MKYKINLDLITILFAISVFITSILLFGFKLLGIID
jgi:hypothetical protein